MTTQETIDQAARVLRPHLSAAARSAIQQVRDAAQALADAGLLSTSAERCATWNDLYRKIGDAEAERDQARATIARLNRRAQLAEAALHKQLKHPNGAPDPTVEALGERVRDLEATIQRVRDLHVPHGNDCGCLRRDVNGSCFHAGTCRGCGRGYPCPTIRALDQEATE